MSPTPLELAEDFALYLPPRADYLQEVTDEYVLTIGNLYASVVRIRLGDVERAVGDIRARLAGEAETVTWWCGEATRPSDIQERLFALGLTLDEDPLVASMLLDEPPTGEPDAEVRRVETFEDFSIAMKIDIASSQMSDTQREHRLRRIPVLWDVMREQGAAYYLGYVDGEPVSMARAFFVDGAVLLMGGATLPEARGRGVYFALVHARWRDAVERGTPRLVVQAGQMSRPILERAGFRKLGEIRLLIDRLA